VEDARRRETEIENNRALQALKIQIEDLNIILSQYRKQIQDYESVINRRDEEIRLLRKQVSEVHNTESIVEELQKLIDQSRADLKLSKDQNITLSGERDNLFAEKSRLQKQIEFLEASLAQHSTQDEDNLKAQQHQKESERTLRAEIASRDNKISILTSQQDSIKAESQRLNQENLILEQEKAKLKQDIEGLKGLDKAKLLSTVESLRAEIAEKEELNNHLIDELAQTKIDIDKLFAENGALKKASKESPEKITETETFKITKESPQDAEIEALIKASQESPENEALVKAPENEALKNVSTEPEDAEIEALIKASLVSENEALIKASEESPENVALKNIAKESPNYEDVK